MRIRTTVTLAVAEPIMAKNGLVAVPVVTSVEVVARYVFFAIKCGPPGVSAGRGFPTVHPASWCIHFSQVGSLLAFSLRAVQRRPACGRHRRDAKPSYG